MSFSVVLQHIYPETKRLWNKNNPSTGTVLSPSISALLQPEDHWCRPDDDHMRRFLFGISSGYENISAAMSTLSTLALKDCKDRNGLAGRKAHAHKLVCQEWTAQGLCTVVW